MRSSSIRIFLFTLVVTLVMSNGFFSGCGYSQGVVQKAPDFSLQSLDGNMVSLSDSLPKGKAVLMFWTTWCPPCRLEIPHLIKLRKTVDKDELVIMGISNEKRAIVKKVVDKVGINYTVLLEKDNMPQPFGVMRIFRSTGIPCSFYIDPEGKNKTCHIRPNNSRRN